MWFPLSILLTVSLLQRDSQTGGELYQQAIAAVTQAKSLQVELEYVLQPGHENISPIRNRYSLAMVAPEKLTLTLTTGPFGESIIINGDRLYAYSPIMDTYIEQPAPADVRDLLTAEAGSRLLGQMSPGSPILMLNLLLSSDPKNARFLGVVDHDGAQFHEFRVQVGHEFAADRGNAGARDEFGARSDMTVWIAPGQPPLIKRIVTDHVIRRPDAAGGEAVVERAKSQLDFRDWRFNPELPPEAFLTAPPEGAQKVESWDQMLLQRSPPPPTPDQQNPSTAALGASAPQFSLPQLDQFIDLQRHAGKDVVILDFWATWCAPCVRSMPALIETAKEFEGRNVVLYAVNVRESPETVRKFLTRHKWNVQVLLDRDGSVAASYGVQGIPHTVIIDARGTIQAIHRGFDASTKRAIRDQIEKLLAGEEIATP